MEWIKELVRILFVLVLTVLLVAFLYQVPWFLALLLLVPLALSLWFWPHLSTVLSYAVAAIFGTLLTGWSVLRVVEHPETMELPFLWLPLVWGPAGVLVKRLELLVLSAWNRSDEDEFELPDF